jgi:superfamily II DNA or RNA helicase
VTEPLDRGMSESSENARSVLMDRIRALPLETFFGRPTLKAAERLALRKNAWREPLAWFRPDGSDAEALQSEFRDVDETSELVEVYLYRLFGRSHVDSKCTCGQSSCAHAAAMLIRLKRLLDWPRALSPLERWAHSAASEVESTGPLKTRAETECRFVACLLQVDGSRRPGRLFGRLVLIDEVGEVQRPNRCMALEELPGDASLSPQILSWQTRLATGQRSQRADIMGYRLEGAGADLLADLLKQGICYHAETRRPIHPAPARQPRWQWFHDELAQARVALDCDGGAVEVIDLGSLYYLDEASGECGSFNLSRRAYDLIERMPPIPPGENHFRASWPPHPLLAAVPPPPPEPPLREIRVSMVPIVVIGACFDPDRENYVFYVRPFADYGGCRLPLAVDAWRQRVVRRLSAEYVWVHREVDRESRASRALASEDVVSLRRLISPGWRRLTPMPDPLDLVHREHNWGGAETFATLSQLLSGIGFRVEYDPELPFTLLAEDTRLTATLNESQSAGWTQFELAATMDGGEINILPTLLTGIARHSFSLTPLPNEAANAHWLAPIAPDRFLPLQLKQIREWLTPLLENLEAPTATRRKTLTLSHAQTLALGETLEHQGVVIRGELAGNVSETLASLRAAQVSSSLIETPPAFRGVLRVYQREGLQWLQALRQCGLGGILADEMGLGKTVQVIAHLACEMHAGRLDRPALIVAPTSLAFNWMDELERFTPEIRCINFTGQNRGRFRDQLRHAQVIVTTYALLGIELQSLQQIAYSLLVLDEAQWIKNSSTQTARAVRNVRARHRIVVSGTPLENHLGELWAHMDAVMPGYLGDLRSFNRSFRVPIERLDADGRMAILRQRIAPFLLRRSKAAVAPELPPKTETVLRVVMGEAQRRLYESLRLSLSKQVREAFARYSDEQSRIVVLSALLRLRQVCCDPRLLEAPPESGESAKLVALLELLSALREERRQVLVFSQFTSMLALISEALTARRMEHDLLTGSTRDRSLPVRRFQSGTVAILLASLKAGGVGLNLTGADAVVHYDPWWNPAVEQQADDRAHRIGRERPIFIYKLLCVETIEEKIESMKARKSELAGAVLCESPQSAPSLSATEVRTLFDLAAGEAQLCRLD